MKWFVGFFVLAVLQGWLKPAPDVTGSESLASRFPGATQTLVYGGFQPVLVQWLWYEYAVSRQEGRILDTLRSLEVLHRVEPDNSRALRFLAHVLAHDMVEREPTPRGKVLRVLDGLRILREAEERSPEFGKDPHLPALRGQILSGAWTADPLCIRAYFTRRKATPLEHCRDAWARALELAPGSRNVRIALADAERQYGLERLLLAGDASSAREVLARAAAVLTPSAREAAPLVGALIDGWAGVVGALDDPKLAPALDALREVLEAVPQDESGGFAFEAALVRAALPLLLTCAERQQEWSPEAALSVVSALRRISAKAAQGLAGNEPVTSRAVRYRERWGALLDALARDLPERATAIASLRSPW